MKEWRIIGELKNRNVVYSRADKSNEIVIMDKKDYRENMLQMIADGPYEEIKVGHQTPVDKFQEEVKEELKRHRERGIISEAEKLKLAVTNPMIPRIYGLPKTHKAGNKMRPICSNVNAPTCRIAKKLTTMNKLLKPHDPFSIKNTKELIESLGQIKLSAEEELCSFDVEALYPSVTTDEALKGINTWLNNQDIDDDTAETYSELAKICLS
jgi:hypothetical protein